MIIIKENTVICCCSVWTDNRVFIYRSTQTKDTSYTLRGCSSIWAKPLSTSLRSVSGIRRNGGMTRKKMKMTAERTPLSSSWPADRAQYGRDISKIMDPHHLLSNQIWSAPACAKWASAYILSHRLTLAVRKETSQQDKSQTLAAHLSLLLDHMDRHPPPWTEDPADIYQRQRALRSTNDPSWDLSFERKFLTLLNSLLIIVFMSVITATCFCSVLSEWMSGSIHLQNEGTISKMFSKKKERACKHKLCEMIFSELNCSYSHCALPWVKWSC